MNTKPKRIYRSEEERMLCGVCGGFAEYFNIDPSIVRLIVVVIALMGYGIFAYIVAAIVIPDESKLPKHKKEDISSDESQKCEEKTEEKTEEETEEETDKTTVNEEK